MFLHGRECYRRNSDLVCYTFYKNMLYVVPQFWFGFFSAFSGQVLYEPFIFQLYNITFTGLPIIWYGLFDWQYEKKVFLQPGNNHLYQIGIDNSLFSVSTFWTWIGYGWVQAGMIFAICFWANQQFTAITDASGKDYDFWEGGMNVFWVCIFLANLTLLKLHNNFTGWGEAIMFVCAFSYWLIVWMESLLPMFPQVYRFMEQDVSSGVAWLGALFALTILVTVDVMTKAVWTDWLYRVITKKDCDGAVYQCFKCP